MQCFADFVRSRNKLPRCVLSSHLHVSAYSWRRKDDPLIVRRRESERNLWCRKTKTLQFLWLQKPVTIDSCVKLILLRTNKHHEGTTVSSFRNPLWWSNSASKLRLKVGGVATMMGVLSLNWTAPLCLCCWCRLEPFNGIMWQCGRGVRQAAQENSAPVFDEWNCITSLFCRDVSQYLHTPSVLADNLSLGPVV